MRRGIQQMAQRMGHTGYVATEHEEQVAYFQWCSLMVRTGRIPELEWTYAVPNGGARHKVVALKLKAEGVKKGVLDIENPYPRHGYTGLHIEMKRRQDYKVSLEQHEWITILRSTGRLVVVAPGWDVAKIWTEWYFGLIPWFEAGPPPKGPFKNTP